MKSPESAAGPEKTSKDRIAAIREEISKINLGEQKSGFVDKSALSAEERVVKLEEELRTLEKDEAITKLKAEVDAINKSVQSPSSFVDKTAPSAEERVQALEDQIRALEESGTTDSKKEGLYDGTPHYGVPAVATSRESMPAVVKEGEVSPAVAEEILDGMSRTPESAALPQWYLDRMALTFQGTDTGPESKVDAVPKTAEGLRAEAVGAKMSEGILDKAKRLGGVGFEKTVGLLRDIGEAYKKVPLKYKIGFGLALAAAGFMTAGLAGLGAASVVGRTLGGLGMFASLDAASRPRGGEKPAMKSEVIRFVATAGTATVLALLIPELFRGAAQLTGADHLLNSALNSALGGAVTPEHPNIIEGNLRGADGVTPDANNPNSVAGPVSPAIHPWEGVAPAAANPDASIAGAAAPTHPNIIEGNLRGPDGSVGGANTPDLLPTEEMVAAAEAPAFEVATPHTVVPGDNLWNILKNEMPEFQGLSPEAQKTAIANLLEKIKLDPEAYGIVSGNVDLIGRTPGEVIDLTKIQSLLHGDAMPTAAHVDAPTAPSADVPTPASADSMPPLPEPRPFSPMQLAEAYKSGLDDIFNIHNAIGNPDVAEYMKQPLTTLGTENLGPVGDSGLNYDLPGRLHAYLLNQFDTVRDVLGANHPDVQKLADTLGYKKGLFGFGGSIGNGVDGTTVRDAVTQLIQAKHTAGLK